MRQCLEVMPYFEIRRKILTTEQNYVVCWTKIRSQSNKIISWNNETIPQNNGLPFCNEDISKYQDNILKSQDDA